ncbi:MAG TPA: hypothetical protein VGG28_21225 [Kofleriaceae bacterium]
MNDGEAVRDVGYERYAGARRDPATRWRVLARRQLASAWETWWHYKLALAIAVVVTCVFGGMMYFFTDAAMFRGFRWVSGLTMTIADGAVPASLQWFRRAAFVLSTATAATAIAADRESGAFALYVARSTRPIDYMIGKLAAMLALVGSLAILGPAFLALLRLGLYEDADHLVMHLGLVGNVVLIGVLTTLVYAIVPLAISSLLPSRAQAIAVWAGYWLVVGSICAVLGAMTTGWISALDLPSALDSITNQLFSIHLSKRLRIPFDVALASIAIHVTVALAIIAISVRRAHHRGFGAS